MAERKKASAEQISKQNEYNKANYDRLTVMLPKGTRQKYRAHAESKGLSLNALIVQLLDKDIKQA